MIVDVPSDFDDGRGSAAMTGDAHPFVVGPGEGQSTEIGGLGVDFKVWGETTGRTLSIIEHPMQPGRLVPPHTHHDEDELSYVLEGSFGVRIGDDVRIVGPGTYVYKPKGVPHTFWNAGDRLARLIEIIWPAGFEYFFKSLGEAARTALSPEEFAREREALAARYRVSFVPEWIDELKARYGLKLLGEP
jgi:quercetin dioxygenase-like cupin family protein